MADEMLLDRIQDLSDLELATLICLVAEEHCIIDTDAESRDKLAQELELVAARVFGLSHAVLDCNEHTTLDDFAQAILTVEGSPTGSNPPARTRQGSYFVHPPALHNMSNSLLSEGFAENSTIANVIIAKNLDRAPKQIQVQALELMRTRRIYTRTSVQNTPKRFLFVALLAAGRGPRLTKHLNEHMFISHFHSAADSFSNLKEIFDEETFLSSATKKSPVSQSELVVSPRVSAADVEHLARLGNLVTACVDIKQYQQNIVSFLRLHRGVAGGISAVATKHFDKLARCLAPLHGLSYTTPSLVVLATRKVFSHRIYISNLEFERSIQWGSSSNMVKMLLDSLTIDQIIEDILDHSIIEILL